jgi:uncharacterized protein YjbI with pentapeptide repeats
MLRVMTEFKDRDLSGAEFFNVDLGGARFRNVSLVGAVLRGVWMEDVEISGEVVNVRVNGVDIGPLVEAELERRHPELALLRPDGPEGFRHAYDRVMNAWDGTVERARRLPPALLHERVDDEWSFIETLRHLVFATDAWVLRAMLGRPSPYDALDLPHDEMGDVPGVPRDLDARPSLDEVLALRADRRSIVRRVLADLTDEQLAGDTEPVLDPGYPASEPHAVRRCLECILSEEWWHRSFAERDLAVLEIRSRV